MEDSRGESWFPLTRSLLGICLFTFSLTMPGSDIELCVCVCVCVFACTCVFCFFCYVCDAYFRTFLYMYHFVFVLVLACFGLLYFCVCMCVTYLLDAHILQYILVNLTFLLLLNYSCLGSLHI